MLRVAEQLRQFAQQEVEVGFVIMTEDSERGMVGMRNGGYS